MGFRYIHDQQHKGTDPSDSILIMPPHRHAGEVNDPRRREMASWSQYWSLWGG
jgi:hypothetical protein